MAIGSRDASFNHNLVISTEEKSSQVTPQRKPNLCSASLEDLLRLFAIARVSFDEMAKKTSIICTKFLFLLQKKTYFLYYFNPTGFFKSFGFIVCANLIRIIISLKLLDISNK